MKFPHEVQHEARLTRHRECCRLIGGRLLPGARSPVAQFMYHDVTGLQITVYVSAEIGGSNDARFRYAQEGPVNVYYWLDRKSGYAISAGIDKGEIGHRYRSSSTSLSVIRIDP